MNIAQKILVLALPVALCNSTCSLPGQGNDCLYGNFPTQKQYHPAIQGCWIQGDLAPSDTSGIIDYQLYCFGSDTSSLRLRVRESATGTSHKEAWALGRFEASALNWYTFTDSLKEFLPPRDSGKGFDTSALPLDLYQGLYLENDSLDIAASAPGGICNDIQVIGFRAHKANKASLDSVHAGTLGKYRDRLYGFP